MSLFENLQSIFSKPTNIIALISLLILLFGFFKIRKVALTTQIISRIGLAVALATILNMIKLFQLPMGGSVTLASMVPLILIALIYGPEIGFLTGFVFGIVDAILGGYIVHPMQLLLDYPLAYMMIGLAGYFKNKITPRNIIIASILAFLGRFICHYLSGIIFFGSYAIEKGKSPYIYSLTYNGSFLSIDALICIFILSLLPMKRLISMLKK